MRSENLRQWPAAHEYIRVCGRHLRETNSAAEGVIYFDWPGIRIEFLCTGRQLTLLLSGAPVYFDVFVNGSRWNTGKENAALIAGAEQAEIPLPQGGAALISIQQRSECLQQPVLFRGIAIEGGDLLPMPKRRKPRVEFIGDSFFVGYGNLLPVDAPQRDGLSPDKIAAFTDTQQGMAALCGESLGLDWRIAAISGRGMVRNYPDSVTGSASRNLPDSYGYPLHTQVATGLTAACDQVQDDFVPEIVVINLGTNDFSTPLVQTEFCGDGIHFEEIFLSRYRIFLNGLSQRYPGVRFLLVGVPHPASRRQPVLLRKLTDALRGRLPVDYCELPEVDLSGCDGHPSAAGHRACATLLAEALRPLLRDKQATIETML